MPSNWLYVDTQFPQFTNESPNEKITIIQNYMYMLVEQMRYTLHNLDTSNMNTAARVAWEETLTSPLHASIKDAEGSITELELTAKGLDFAVNNEDGKFAKLAFTVEGLNTAVNGEDGKFAKLAFTVEGLNTAVNGEDGKFAKLAFTVEGLNTAVNGENGKFSTLQQKVDGFTLSVTNGTTSSSIVLKSGETVISSQTIRFTGDVVFASHLQDGETIISGANILTGAIDADYIHLGGEMIIYDGPEPTVTSYSGTFGSYQGWASDEDGGLYKTYGVGIRYSSTRGQLLCTSGGVWCGYGSSSGVSAYSAGVTITGGTIVMDGTVKDSSGTVIHSDRRLKRDIRYDMTALKEILLRARVCTYRRTEGTRLHAGVIAQELETVRDAVGVDSEDYAALCIDEKGYYGVRYLEWVPVHTALLQDHDAMLRDIGKRLTKLEGKI